MTEQITPKLTADRIKKYLEQGKRFDKRELIEFREISIETGISENAEGSARVKIGKTEVLVGVKMNVGEPYPDSQDKGNLMVSVELLPLSSPKYELGPPKFDSIEIGRITDRAIRESKVIELEKLCIKEGEKVWTIFIDVYSINDDGNLIDAACIGAIAALKNAKIPFYDEETGKIDYEKESKQKLPLAKKIPLSISFHKIGDSIIVDPTTEEENISDTRIAIGSADGIISSMQKSNEQSIKVEEMEKVLDMVEEVWKDISKKIENIK